MAITDNRTLLNDCEDDAQTFATSGAQLGTNTLAGFVIEGSASIQTQHSDTYDDTYTTGDSGGSTFDLDFSDTTIWVNVKDNLLSNSNVCGASIVLGDGTDRIGYMVGGQNAPGVGYRKQFIIFALDGSDAAANPGTANVDHRVYAGTEANLAFANITTVGFGSLHAGKASGNIPNVIIDGIYYLANGSYALTINGGTAASPETTLDAVNDDFTAGAGLLSRAFGTIFLFAGSTEWGNPTTVAEHAFEASDEQWVFSGNNGGGRAIGAGNLIYRLVSNATDTGSFKLTRTPIVASGNRAIFDMSDANFDTIEFELCSFITFGTIELPSSGGTSRFTTNCTFTDCDQITNNGADMSGSSVLLSNVAADTGALVWNETSDPDGELDDMTFEQGAAAHHAIDFGTAVTSDITLRGIEFTGFSSSDDVDGSTLRFLAPSGALTCNLVDCTVGGVAASTSNVGVDDAAGITVTLEISVSLEVNGATEGSRLSMIGDGGAEDGVELLSGYANSSGLVTASFGGTLPQNVLVRARNAGIVAAVIQDDALSFTDYTSEARDQVGVDDVVLLPASPATGDNLYVGGLAPFGEMLFNISTAGASYAGLWEYWNGAWVTLTITLDETLTSTEFDTTGWGRVRFTAPGDWATSTENSQGPFYYARYNVTTGAGTGPSAEYVTLNDTIKYLPFDGLGTIDGGGLVSTVVWQEDTNNP